MTNYTLTVAGPPCAADVTAQVGVTFGGFTRNLMTGRFSQTVTLRNNGAAPVAGPVSFALGNLSPNAQLANLSGTTSCAAPLGRPLVNVNVGGDQVLSPGETAAVTLEFVNSITTQPITYTGRVLAGGTQR